MRRGVSAADGHLVGAAVVGHAAVRFGASLQRESGLVQRHNCRRDQHRDGLADRFGGGPAEDALGRGIPQDDALGIHGLAAVWATALTVFGVDCAACGRPSDWALAGTVLSRTAVPRSARQTRRRRGQGMRSRNPLRLPQVACRVFT
jgi:hypothetical protein